MRIQYSPYSLIKKTRLNALDQLATQDGALIKLIDEDNNWGVADLCPWPSLGDLSLIDEINFMGNLYQRALELAADDLQARKEKKSLLQNKWIVNNTLVSNYRAFDYQNPKHVGRTLKIKGDRDIEALASLLNVIHVNNKIRLDFNGVLNKLEFQSFLQLLSNKERIEYIEDPTAYDVDNWILWNKKIPLASDFVLGHEGFTFKIVKPSREKIQNGTRFTITSAMDHPVGVAHALRYAQSFARNVSGLLTLGFYEPTPFQSAFAIRNDVELNFSAKALGEYGIGMTSELNELGWKNSI